MPEELNTDAPNSGMPPTVPTSDSEDDTTSIDDRTVTRPPTPDTPSTVGMTADERDSRPYIPYDLRIFHPDTLFTTHESLERERAGISATEVDPSEELRQELEVERWMCHWLSMRLHRAKRANVELRMANAKLEEDVERLKRDRETLQEQLSIIAAGASDTDRNSMTNGLSSVRRGFLRSRVVSRVSRAIRRAPSPLVATDSESVQDGNTDTEA